MMLLRHATRSCGKLLVSAVALALLAAPADAAMNHPHASLSAWHAKARATGKSVGDGSLLHTNEVTPRATIRKPKTDAREYLYTTFASGLPVLAVQDPSAKKIGFAVAVEAGSLEDPIEFQGLAHFCEHMLFLGSEKYPKTDEYTRQLALFGGTHNAYTSAEATVYFNEIGIDGVEKAMDIFAQFFIAPSFASDMVNKEIHAVDSEHKKNQPDIQHRLWHLLRSRANPKNPFHQFSTGHLGTLKTVPEKNGLSLVDALRKFHNENYCTRRLHLVMVGNLSTSDQLDLAHRHFDALPETSAGACKPRPVYTDIPLYTPALGNLGRRFTVSTHGTPELWMMIPMPPLKKHYKEMAESYVFNALANYGTGSLKAALLKEDLSQHYSYFAENSVAGSIIFVTFQLTAKGAENPEKVLEHFFAYLNVVKKSGLNAQLMDNLKQLRQVSFDFQEKQSSEFNFVSSLAGSLPNYGPEDVLTGGTLIDKPDMNLVQQILDAMVPSNMNIAFVTPTLDETTAKFHEQYYDFKYNEEALDPSLIKRLEGASGVGLLPPPDLAFVPRRLELISEQSGIDGPQELIQSKRVDGWWLGLGNVKLPKALIQLKVQYADSFEKTAQRTILAGMHARIVQLILEEPSDMLQTCGVGYNIAAHSGGLKLTFSGFDEYISELVALVLPRVRRTGHEGAAVFEQARRQMMLDLADVTKMQPYQHAMEAFEVVTRKGSFSRKELLLVAQNTNLVNPTTYEHFLDEAFADAHMSALVAGNMGRQRSTRLMEESGQALEIQSHLPGVQKRGLPRVLDPMQPMEVRVANPIRNDPNSATMVAYQFGVPSLLDRVHLSMLGEIIDRPVFEALRTERQLGYVVWGFVAPHSSILEVRVVVQGFRESPDVVEPLIQDTVKNLTRRISALTQAEISTRRHTIRSALTKEPSTLSEFAGEFWTQISEGTYCFNKRKKMLAQLDAEEVQGDASKSLLKAWLRTVNPSSGKPKKIAVKLFGAGAAGRPGDAQQPNGVGDSAPITLIDSTALGARLKDQQYWPDNYICQ